MIRRNVCNAGSDPEVRSFDTRQSDTEFEGPWFALTTVQPLDSVHYNRSTRMPKKAQLVRDVWHSSVGVAQPILASTKSSSSFRRRPNPWSLTQKSEKLSGKQAVENVGTRRHLQR